MEHKGSDTKPSHGGMSIQLEQIHADSTKSTEKTTSAVTPEQAARKSANKPNDPITGLLSGLFSGGKIDSDRLIIILLIIILAREGADLKLLIALGYILI